MPNLDAFKKYMYNNYCKDTAKMLLITGTLGWIFSAAGQIVGIASNKKVAKKEKKFLIPQEIADAVINIASFYIVTNKLQNFAKARVSTGKIITPAIRKICEKFNINHTAKFGEIVPDIGKGILDKAKEYENALKLYSEGKLTLTKAEVESFTTKKDQLNVFYDKKYSPFEGGVKVVGNIIGAVVSSNIITPLIRNPIASFKQKLDMSREENKDIVKPSSRVVLGQNNLNGYNAQAVNPYRVSGVGMRV